MSSVIALLVAASLQQSLVFLVLLLQRALWRGVGQISVVLVVSKSDPRGWPVLQLAGHPAAQLHAFSLRRDCAELVFREHWWWRLERERRVTLFSDQLSREAWRRLRMFLHLSAQG